MSVINLSSEDEDTEDVCIIIYSDEEETTIKKPHTIFVVDDDESNDKSCGLPEIGKEINSGQLPIKATEEEKSEDPFDMRSEFDVMDSGNKERMITIEESLLNRNVKPVHIKEIIEDCTKNTTISKVNIPKTDDNDFLINSRNEISAVEINNLTECCDPLNSANSDYNKQDSASFNKRLAECLVLLIKDKSITTHNSSGEGKLLSLGREKMCSVDAIINKVSESSFDVDGYIDLISHQYDESCSKNKIGGRRGLKINTEVNRLNAKDIEEPKSNEVSTQNEDNLGCMGHNECEQYKPIETNKKKGRKRGWRKHQTKLNGSLCMPNEQGPNLGDENKLARNSSLEESSVITNNLLVDTIKKDASGQSATTKDISTSRDSTQQSHAHSDLKSSNTNLDRRSHSCTSYTSSSSEFTNNTRKIEQQSLLSKSNCKDGIQNTTAKTACDAFIEDLFQNQPVCCEKANNNPNPPKIQWPHIVPLNPPTNLSPPDLDDNFLKGSGNSYLAALKEKKNIANKKQNSFTTAYETILSHKLQKRPVVGSNDINEDEFNPNSKSKDTLGPESIASKRSENSSHCFHQEKYEASSGHRNVTTESKENESFNVTKQVLKVGSGNDPRDLQSKDSQNTTIGNNPFSNQITLSKIAVNLQLKTYTQYYKLVFDDNGESLCMKMGDRVRLTAEEARSCKSRIVTAQKFTCQQLRASEVQLAKMNFYDTLAKYKSSFFPLYVKLFHKIILEMRCQSNDQRTLLLLTWFLKMYLRVTTLAPEFMDCLNEIKVCVRALVPEKHLFSQPIFEMFACNEAEFESKCCTVVQHMHSIFNSTQNLKEYESNGCNNSCQNLNQPISNLHKPKTSVHIAERDVNVKSVESDLVASKPTTLLEQILNRNDTPATVKHNSKALELEQLEPPPYNCNKPGSGRYQEKLGPEEIWGHIGRDSSLSQPFTSPMTNLSTLGEKSIYANEVTHQEKLGPGETWGHIRGDSRLSQPFTSVMTNLSTLGEKSIHANEVTHQEKLGPGETWGHIGRDSKLSQPFTSPMTNLSTLGEKSIHANEETHHEKLGPGETWGHIGRDSRLSQPFTSVMTNLSTFGEQSIHAKELTLQPRSSYNYNQPQAQFNISGAYNSSQDRASTTNTHSTKDHEFTPRNSAERGRPTTQTVTSTLPVGVRSCNDSATQDANQCNIDTKSNNNRSHEQMPKSSEISSSSVFSSAGSRVSYSTNNNLPFEPELGTGKYTTEMNHQEKRKCTDSDQYFTKKLMAYYKNDSFSNKWVGKYNTGNCPLNHSQPSLIVNNSQGNSKTYTQHSQNGIRPTSIYRHPPPDYPKYLSNRYHRHPPPNYPKYLSNQYHRPPEYYSQPNNAMQRRFKGSSTSSGYHIFQGEHHGSRNYEHHIEIHGNNNYSLEMYHPRNYSNSPSINTRPSNESVQQSTSCNESHIAVTINNFNISNVLSPTNVIKHVNSLDTWKDMQQEKFSLVPEPTPKETIHHLGAGLSNNTAT